MPDPERTHLLVRVAELYYEREMSQREIAEEMQFSRAMVSRLLAEARNAGIVTIHIHRPVEKREDLAAALRVRFDLVDAVVVPVPSTADARRVVGAASAEYLRSRVRDRMTVGLSWGRDLFEAINAYAGPPLEGVQVVQLAGGLGEGDLANDGPNLVRDFAEKVRGSARYLYAPTVVATAATGRTLLEQPQIAQTVERAGTLDLAVTSVGALNDSGSSLARAGYLDDDDRASLQASGGIAHILGYVIGADGRPVDHPYNARVVAAPLESLRHSGCSVCLVSDAGKAGAVEAAMRGGYFDVVIASEDVAQALLATEPIGVAAR